MPHSDWKHRPKELSYSQYILLIHSSMRGIRTHLCSSPLSVRRLYKTAERDIQKYVDTEKCYGFGEEYADSVKVITQAIITLWDVISDDAYQAEQGHIPVLQPNTKYRKLMDKIKEELK